MLADNVPLFNPHSGLNDITMSLIDVDNGRSVRRYQESSVLFYELTVARQTTNENAPLPTNRIMIRLDKQTFDSTLAKPMWVKQSVYVVITIPSHASAALADIKLNVKRLISFFCEGNVGSDLVSEDFNTYLESMVTKVVTGQV